MGTNANKVTITTANQNKPNGVDALNNLHPNGLPNKGGLKRPKRNDEPFMEDIFPDTPLGQLLRGIHRSFLIKYEPRIGWARKGACEETKLLAHPCEVVASHQWGVMWLVLTISSTPEFQTELPKFDRQKAYEMAAAHDLAELVTGDITPIDGISPEEKHLLESEAMKSILSFYPLETSQVLSRIYNRYEDRQCVESKFVKDCDRLDFMITAFVLERQGFSGFKEFYINSNREQFSTKIAKDLSELLLKTRDKLQESDGKLYIKN